jgi:hypothetical protein
MARSVEGRKSILTDKINASVFEYSHKQVVKAHLYTGNCIQYPILYPDRRVEVIDFFVIELGLVS